MEDQHKEFDIGDIVTSKGYSPNKERAQLEELERLIFENKLEATIIQYTPQNEPPTLQAASNSAPGRDNESNNHIRLKAIAAQYIRETGSEPVFEQYKWYGIADVGTEDETRTAECGSLRIGKFIEAFGFESSLPLLGEPNPGYGCVDELIYIPYKSNEEYPPVNILSIKPT